MLKSGDSLIPFFVVIIIAGIAYKVYRDAIKDISNRKAGSELEDRVVCEIRKQQRFYGGGILQNMYLPTGGKVSHTEVDVVYVLRNMIFVFECKNYNADISLDPTNPMRFMTSYKSGKTFFFRSPILQNSGHIKNINNQLNRLPWSQDYEVYNIIVFSDTADISSVKGDKIDKVINQTNFNTLGGAKKIEIIKPSEIPNIIRYGINNNELNLFDSKLNSKTKQLETNALEKLKGFTNVSLFKQIRHVLEIKFSGNYGGY